MHSVTGFHSILQGLLSPYFVGAWCLALALLSCFQIAQLLRVLRPFSSVLRNFVTAVKKSDLQNLEKISAKHPVLASVWKSYSSCLYEHNEQSWRSLRESNTFFAPEKTYEVLTSSKQREATSTMFSSLGILGTFLGLSAGVWIAQTYFDGDTQHIQYGLSQLLAGAGLAFMTSLTGLFCSIVYVRVERALIDDLDNLLAHINTLLDLRFPLHLWEQSLFEQLVVVEEQQKTLEKISTELHRSRKQDMTWHAKCLKELVQAFQVELHGATRDHLEQMSLAIEGSVEQLSEMNAHMDSLGNSWEQKVEKQQEDFAKKFDDFQVAVSEPMGHFVKHLGEHLNSMIEEMASNFSANDINKQCVDMEKSFQSFTDALQLFAGDLQIMRAELSSEMSAHVSADGDPGMPAYAPQKVERRRRFGLHKPNGARA